MSDAWLGLGSNLGDREAAVRRAVELLGREAGQIVAVSSIVRSAPQGFASANEFANAAVHIRTTLSPMALLRATQDIERRMGRTRKSAGGQHFDREIDIDILLYDDIALNTPELTIPHPRMWEREFVVGPLREIYPDSNRANPALPDATSDLSD